MTYSSNKIPNVNIVGKLINIKLPSSSTNIVKPNFKGMCLNNSSNNNSGASSVTTTSTPVNTSNVELAQITFSPILSSIFAKISTDCSKSFSGIEQHICPFVDDGIKTKIYGNITHAERTELSDGSLYPNKPLTDEGSITHINKGEAQYLHDRVTVEIPSFIFRDVTKVAISCINGSAATSFLGRTCIMDKTKSVGEAILDIHSNSNSIHYNIEETV